MTRARLVTQARLLEGGPGSGRRPRGRFVRPYPGQNDPMGVYHRPAPAPEQSVQQKRQAMKDTAKGMNTEAVDKPALAAQARFYATARLVTADMEPATFGAQDGSGSVANVADAEAMGVSAGAALTRKGEDDGDSHVDEVPLDAFKSDLRRKVALRKVMAPPEDQQAEAEPSYGFVLPTRSPQIDDPQDGLVDNWKKFQQAVAGGYKAYEGEVAPPGWEGTVKKMKGHPEIDNPWALSWWMKDQGYAPHASEGESIIDDIFGDDHSGDDDGEDHECHDDLGFVVDCTSPDAIDASEGGEDPRRATKPYGMAPQQEAEDGALENQESKEDVNYRYAVTPDEMCGKCKFFQAPSGCEKVAGLIRRIDVCDLFEPRGAEGEGRPPMSMRMSEVADPARDNAMSKRGKSTGKDTRRVERPKSTDAPIGPTNLGGDLDDQGEGVKTGNSPSSNPKDDYPEKSAPVGTMGAKVCGPVQAKFVMFPHNGQMVPKPQKPLKPGKESQARFFAQARLVE